MLKDFPVPLTMRKPCNAKHIKRRRRSVSKSCVKEFKAWREDAPFAAVRLALALIRAGSSIIETYLRPPWDARAFVFNQDIGDCLYTYAAAHVSLTNKGKLAVYRTRDDYVRGREIVMTPGRVYTQAYAHVTPAMAQQFAEKFSDMKYLLTTDPDVMTERYISRKHVTSCMATLDTEGDTHPVTVYTYTGNGLALAYSVASDGETSARCLVNTERKKAVRNYGDQRLVAALQRDGYDFNMYDALQDVKLKAVPIGSGLMMPYIDGIGCVAWDGCSDYCTVSSSGNYSAQQTNGTTMDEEEENQSECGQCGDYHDEDDGGYSHHHDINICDSCLRDCYTIAIYNIRGHQTYVHDDDIVTVNGRSYFDHDDVLEAHNIVQTLNGDYAKRDECVYLEYFEDYVLQTDCTELSIEHDGDSWALTKDTITITLNGDELTVHERYDGPTDDSIKEERQLRRRAIRLRLHRRRRLYSRHPNTRKRLTMRRKA